MNLLLPILNRSKFSLSLANSLNIFCVWYISFFPPILALYNYLNTLHSQSLKKKKNTEISLLKLRSVCLCSSLTCYIYMYDFGLKAHKFLLVI